MTDNLITELEDSIRQEKLERLWKEYGGYIIASAVLAVLMTALVTGWRSWNERVNGTQTAIVMEALEQEDEAAALAGIIEELRPNLRAVSHLTAAGTLLKDGKKDEALAAYKAAASDKGIDAEFRDLARLMAVRLEWATATPETDAQALVNALSPIIGNKKSPWHYHARMQAAVMLAHGLSDYAKAREHLAVLKDAEGLPNSILERAKALDHVYELKMSLAQPAQNPEEDAKDKAKEEPAG